MSAPRFCLSRSKWLALVAAAILVALQRPSIAQYTGGAFGVAAERVTFTFPGGTLEEYVALVKEKFGENAEIIVAPELKDLRIEPVEFKTASLFVPVQLLGHLASGRIVIDEISDVWRVSPPPLHTRVFSVRAFINEKSGEPQESAIKALISAVEATLALGSQSVPTVKLKVHPDTGLLLVRGTEEQVEIVEEVVSQLSAAEKPMERTGEEANAQKRQVVERNKTSPRVEPRQQIGDPSNASEDVPQSRDSNQRSPVEQR